MSVEIHVCARLETTIFYLHVFNKFRLYALVYKSSFLYIIMRFYFRSYRTVDERKTLKTRFLWRSEFSRSPSNVLICFIVLLCSVVLTGEHV